MSMRDTDYGRRVLIKAENGQEVAATFIRWAEVSRIVPPSHIKGGHNGGVINEIVALVEMDNGIVAEAPTCCCTIVFTTGIVDVGQSQAHQPKPVSEKVRELEKRIATLENRLNNVTE